MFMLKRIFGHAKSGWQRSLRSKSYSPGSYTAPSLSRVHWKPVAEAIAEEAELHGTERIFLITSQSLRTNTDIIDNVRAQLGGKCVGVWSGFRPHSPREDVLAAANAVRAAGGADLLVSIGGGSVTDGTKAIGLSLEQGIEDVKTFDDFKCIKSFFDPPHYQHSGQVKQIAVPTTLSGGEFTPISGVTDLSIPHKQGYMHPLLQPPVVLFDPAITVHTPEWLWLSTGVRSLDHCTEALCSINSTYFSDGYAKAGIELLVDGLSRVKSNPDDLDARLKCQMGCWMGCATVSMMVHYGASHAIGHVLGGIADVPHGYTSCINLPYVLKWNEQSIPEKCAAVSKAYGQPGKLAHEVVDEFIRSLGMPRTLGDVDFPMEKLQQVSELSMKDPWTHTNPRKIESPEDVMEILTMAAEGASNKCNMVK